MCRTVYDQLKNYTECEFIAGTKPPLFDGGDLYPWTNNDSLIDWSGVNRTTTQGARNVTLNGTTATGQTENILPPFELYQVSELVDGSARS